MMYVGYPFGVAHLSLFPELSESFIAAGHFVDQCEQSGVVGILGEERPQAPDRQSRRFLPVGKDLLGRGIREAPARKVVSDFESWCQRTSDRVCGQHVLKCLYLVTRSLDPTGTGQKRWTMRWKPALNAFAITFADRMPVSENN